MNDASFDTLYAYYERQSILPTHASFQGAHALDEYAWARAELFTGKLKLPQRLFEGAQVLEFGPDSGENSLVFARWGAQLTLVEPNSQALPQIRAYFRTFGLEANLEALVPADVLNFETTQQFDILDAEGFIYTVDTHSWLQRFSSLLKTSGLFIVSYYERRGGFMELFTKALHARVVDMSGWEPLAAARRLFEAKWDSIPHVRTFESWTMDTLGNPFARYRYFIDPSTLCHAARAAGFRLYSSWPCYRDPLAVYWHKRRLTVEEELCQIDEHVLRSALSFMSGSKLYLAQADRSACERMARLIHDVVVRVDELCERSMDVETLEVLERNIDELAQSVREAELVEAPGARARFEALLESVLRALGHVRRGDVAALCDVTSNDPAFLASWGMPAHFSVFEKMRA